MSNPVFQLAVRSLSKVVSGRAAETMLNASLRDLKLSPQTVTARDMQRVLSGPLERRLSQVMPGSSAFEHLRLLARQIERLELKDAALFDQSARTVIWDQEEGEDDAEAEDASFLRGSATGALSYSPPPQSLRPAAPDDVLLDDERRAQRLGRKEEPVTNSSNASRSAQPGSAAPSAALQNADLNAEEFGAVRAGSVQAGAAQTGATQTGAAHFSADDFEFSDPEYVHLQAASKAYALSTPEGQDALLYELARHAGVQTVVLCSTGGQVLNVRAPQGTPQLGSVVAATALLFRQRELKLLSLDLGNATVCMRVVGQYCVALLARGNVNVGRLLSELQQIEVSA